MLLSPRVGRYSCIYSCIYTIASRRGRSSGRRRRRWAVGGGQRAERVSSHPHRLGSAPPRGLSCQDLPALPCPALPCAPALPKQQQRRRRQSGGGRRSRAPLVSAPSRAGPSLAQRFPSAYAAAAPLHPPQSPPCRLPPPQLACLWGGASERPPWRASRRSWGGTRARASLGRRPASSTQALLVGLPVMSCPLAKRSTWLDRARHGSTWPPKPCGRRPPVIGRGSTPAAVAVRCYAWHSALD